MERIADLKELWAEIFMANYDASVRVGTKIDTGNFIKGAGKIKEELANLEEAQRRFIESGGSRQDSVFKGYEKRIRKLKTSLESLEGAQGKSVTEVGHLNDLKVEVEEYAKALKDLESQGKFFGDEEYDKVYLFWKDATDAVKAYRAELDKKTESGQAKQAQEAAREAEKQAAVQQKIEEQAEKALQRENARIQKQIENEARLQAKEEERQAKQDQKNAAIQAKLSAQAQEEARMEYLREQAVVSNQRIVAVMERRKQLLEYMAELEKAGVGRGYEQFESARRELAALDKEVSDYDSDVKKADKSQRDLQKGLGAVVSAFQRLGNVVRNTASRSFHLLGSAAKGALSGMQSLIGKISSGLKKLGERARQSFSTLHKSAGRSNGVLTTMSSRLKSLVLSLLIFNQISRAFSEMTSAVKDGFGNLYKDNEKFKGSVDGLRASILTLQNAFAAAFRPLVDVAIPYIQKAADYMISLLDKVGQFTAAITGQKTYTKVIRQTADAFEEAKKAAEGYLSPLDEINRYSSKEEEKDTDQTGLMFEEAPVSQKFADMAQKVKDVLADLFAPIKEAWDREGDFVIDSWKYGLQEIWDLIKSIGSDFLEVWQQEKTIKIFEDILHIIGDIGLVAGNLAHNFREAWEENETGLHILENIRDIIGVIVANIRHAADATVEWSRDLDFSPLLTKVQEWTASLVPVFDALSGIITDFYEKVLLPLGTWTIEKGLPDLLQVLIDFNNTVDWESLRARLSEFWEHLEPFAEVVGEGLIIFIGRLSEALAGFLNSPALSEFLTMIENWMDNVRPEDVADGLGKIAVAIVALKTASAVFPAVSTAFSVFANIAKGLTGTLSLLSPVIHALAAAISLLASPVGIAIAAVAALAAGFVYLYKTNEDFKASIDTLYNDHIKPFFDSVVEGVGKLKDKFVEFWDNYVKPMLEEWGEKFMVLWEEHIDPALSKIFDALTILWEDALMPLAEWIIDTLLPVLLPIIDEIFNTSIDWIGEMFDEIGDLADIIADCVGLVADLLRGDFSSAMEHAKNIVETVWGGITRIIKGAVERITGWIEGLLSLFDKAESKKSSFNSGDSGQSYSSRSYSVRSMKLPYAADPRIAKLATMEIPGYATGQVIPRTMKQHLAILGDNTQETEVVSPISTMKQAFMEALVEMGSTGGNGQPVILKVILDSKEILYAMVKEGKVVQMSTGKNIFALE